MKDLISCTQIMGMRSKSYWVDCVVVVLASWFQMKIYNKFIKVSSILRGLLKARRVLILHRRTNMVTYFESWVGCIRNYPEHRIPLAKAGCQKLKRHEVGKNLQIRVDYNTSETVYKYTLHLTVLSPISLQLAPPNWYPLKCSPYPPHSLHPTIIQEKVNGFYLRHYEFICFIMILPRVGHMQSNSGVIGFGIWKKYFWKYETNVSLVIYTISHHLTIRLTRPTLQWAFIVKLDDQVFDLRSAANPETNPYKSQLCQNKG